MRIFPVTLPGTMVEGSVLDLSAHGFRAAHHCRALATGHARVMWTSIVGDQVQSGFCYVPD